MFHRTIADNIRVGRPGATDAEVRRAARARARRGVHRGAAGGLRDARRRARREAVGRPAPARGDRARDPEGRADPDPGRGDELARLRERGADPGRALDAAGGPHGHRHRAPAVDGAADGRARRPRARADRRAGHARSAPGGHGIYASLWAHQSGGFLGRRTPHGPRPETPGPKGPGLLDIIAGSPVAIRHSGIEHSRHPRG